MLLLLLALWLIAPAAPTVKAPVPTLTVPRTIAFVSVTCTALAPLFVSDTAPTKLFPFVRVIALAPAEKLDPPGPPD